MPEETFKNGQEKCFSLTAVFSGDFDLKEPQSKKLACSYKGVIFHITIGQHSVRTIQIASKMPVTMEQAWSLLGYTEQLLMVFDGKFYEIIFLAFQGDALSTEEYALCANECIAKRLAYYRTDPSYCNTSPLFLNFANQLNSQIISNWITLHEELEIVHQVALYNIADTGITHDVKCAYFIEIFEPIVEVIQEYEKSFPTLRPTGKNSKDKHGLPSLKTCIDTVISRYGQDVFSQEYTKNKGKFLKTLVDTRNLFMHIKRNQQNEKHLSNREAVLYLVKLCHLYRIVLLSLIGISYEQYQPAVKKSIKRWNNWNGVFDSFITRLSPC